MENHCPHCDSASAILTSVAYNNGSAQWSFYRCGDCNTEWKLTRWHEIIVIKVGATPEEVRMEILRVAVIGHQMAELQRHNAPDEWFRYVH